MFNTAIIAQIPNKIFISVINQIDAQNLFLQ